MEPESTRIPSGRSQLLRSRETRTRVIEAAVACIAEEGFHAANLARIADRAGVTTGAIQHQFGEKAALLAAAVERGFERMADAVARVPARSLALEERVAAFVHGLWDGYDADHTRAGFEILLALRSDAAFRDRTLGFLAGLRERLDRLWMGTFWDADVSRARHVEAQRLIFTTLNGLALERILLPEMPDPQADLERLARGVLAIMKEE